MSNEIENRNPDVRLRELERLAAQGDVHAEARLLIERVRVGELDRGRLEAAALLGHPAAQLATGESGRPTDGWPARAVAAAGEDGPRLAIWLALLAAESAHAAFKPELDYGPDGWPAWASVVHVAPGSPEERWASSVTTLYPGPGTWLEPAGLLLLLTRALLLGPLPPEWPAEFVGMAGTVEGDGRNFAGMGREEGVGGGWEDFADALYLLSRAAVAGAPISPNYRAEIDEWFGGDPAFASFAGSMLALAGHGGDPELLNRKVAEEIVPWLLA